MKSGHDFQGIRFVIALALVLVSCVKPGGGAKVNIVNGETSSSSEDFVVFVKGPKSSYCTGSLVEPNVVMTALHCVGEKVRQGSSKCASIFGQPESDPDYRLMPSMFYSVSLARNVAESGGRHAEDAKVSKIVVGRNCLVGSDIAFLVLDKPLVAIAAEKSKEWYQKNGQLAVVRWDDPVKKGDVVSVVGWGRLADGEAPKERQIRKGVTVVDVGPTSLESQGTDSQLEVVASEFVATEATCVGDSGGPVLDGEHRIVGLTSRGDANCVGTKGIYTSVTAHKVLFDKVLSTVSH